MPNRTIDTRVTQKAAQPNSRGGRRQLGSDAATSLPVYHQLHLVLSQRIREGIYPEGGRLPSEFVLGAKFGVSRVTVRRALAQLEEEGLLVRRRGSGTFVAEREPRAAGPIAGMVENLITIGLETGARLLSFEAQTDAPLHAYDALGMASGDEVFTLQRLRLHRGEPFSHSTVYLRPAEAALLDTEALGPLPVVSGLEQAGLRAASAEQTISATLADDRIAALLEVPLGSPLVRVRRSVLDKDGRTLLFQQSLYRPDRYEYHMLLTRERSTGQPRWRHVG